MYICDRNINFASFSVRVLNCSNSVIFFVFYLICINNSVWTTIIADLSVKVFNITAFPQDLEYNTAEDGTRCIIPNAALLRHTKGRTKCQLQCLYFQWSSDSTNYTITGMMIWNFSSSHYQYISNLRRKRWLATNFEIISPIVHVQGEIITKLIWITDAREFERDQAKQTISQNYPSILEIMFHKFCIYL